LQKDIKEDKYNSSDADVFSSENSKNNELNSEELSEQEEKNTILNKLNSNKLRSIFLTIKSK
jgi:hypothetical protein